MAKYETIIGSSQADFTIGLGKRKGDDGETVYTFGINIEFPACIKQAEEGPLRKLAEVGFRRLASVLAAKYPDATEAEAREYFSQVNGEAGLTLLTKERKAAAKAKETLSTVEGLAVDLAARRLAVLDGKEPALLSKQEVKEYRKKAMLERAKASKLWQKALAKAEIALADDE